MIGNSGRLSVSHTAPACLRSGWARGIAAALALVLFLSVSVALAKEKDKLPARYRDWLEKDVVYIISKEEKDAFLRLARDEDRDKFMDEFWEIRNPTPGSPVNEFKEEHYRRIAFANARFGSEWVANGWQSDRGRIYIILGPPGSRQFFTSGGQVYPIELWFYTANEPSLPPFFYVMFYQKEAMSDFRLYSPYIDGPDKLVRASGAENNPRNAWKFLHDFNPELAKASLTLIPSEPADINSPRSMTSDGMLMKIVNLANDKFHKERIGLQRRLREQVTARLSPDLPALKVATLPLRDALGENFIHYSLQIDEPQNYALGSFKDKYFLNLEVQVRVMDAQKKLIYETTRQAVTYYEEKDLADVRSRPLSFEDRLAVLPGNYELEFLMLNRVNRVYYRASASVRVEPAAVPALTLGRPVLVQHCEPSTSSEDPFSFGGTRCTPQARHEVAPSANGALSLLLPVYLDPAGVAAEAPPLKLKYTVGRLDRSPQNKVVEDSLDRKRFDRFGTLLVGKSIHLQDLPPGSYLLSFQVTDPADGHSAGSTLPFKIAGSSLPPPNLLTSASLLQDGNNGNNDFWRGLCSLAQNAPDQAINFFTHALERSPQHDRARAQLVKLYFARGDFNRVASLFSPDGITKAFDLEAAQDLIASLDKLGQLKQAIQAAEQAIALPDPAPQLYEQLAGLYDRSGDKSRAERAREQARRLTEQKRQAKSDSK